MRRIMLVVFIALCLIVSNGTLLWAADASKSVSTAAKCECGKNCKCEHCATGKSECKCHHHDCHCGKDCKCEHCAKGKGECTCQNQCHCGKDCKCEHCATGKGECKCHKKSEAAPKKG